jgi:hypothetical protein
MRTKISPILLLFAAAALLTLAGCILDSKENARTSGTFSFEGYVGYILEYPRPDSGATTGDTAGLGFTDTEVLLRVDSSQQSDGLVAISLEGDTIALIFEKLDSTETFKVDHADCRFTASATVRIPNGDATVSAPVVFSRIFLWSDGVALVIDEAKSKPADLDSVDFNQKAIAGTYTISCPDPR